MSSANESENLLADFSATHIGYGSIRMEPIEQRKSEIQERLLSLLLMTEAIWQRNAISAHHHHYHRCHRSVRIS
jgi:hypothetical protein